MPQLESAQNTNVANPYKPICKPNNISSPILPSMGGQNDPQMVGSAEIPSVNCCHAVAAAGAACQRRSRAITLWWRCIHRAGIPGSPEHASVLKGAGNCFWMFWVESWHHPAGWKFIVSSFFPIGWPSCSAPQHRMARGDGPTTSWCAKTVRRLAKKVWLRRNWHGCCSQIWS